MVSSGPQQNHVELPAQSTQAASEVSHGSQGNTQTLWQSISQAPLRPSLHHPQYHILGVCDDWPKVSASLLPWTIFFFIVLSTICNNILFLFTCLFTWVSLTKICKRIISCSLVFACLVEWKPETLADTLLFLLLSVTSQYLSACLCF